MKKNEGIKLKINQEITKKHKKEDKSTMLFAECTCGEKILVIPDVAAMSRAVKNHITKHKNANEEFLIEHIFKAASKQMHK